ncbi:MAG: hypothetical protein JNL82_27635 [Myxococcales bacterium]|nr:hypothetical protein [Myxococcales bacterium]
MKPRDEATPDELRTARYQIVLSLLATLLLGLGLTLGYQAATTGKTQECTEAREEEDCAADELCIRGRCVAVPPPPEPLPCQEGDPCDACACGEPLRCDPDTRRCSAPDPPACSPEVGALVRSIREFERERCTRVGGKITECDPKKLTEFFVTHQQFNELLLRLDHTISVHFDTGQPDALAGLSPRAARFYAEQFAQVADRLKDAGTILVLGRASKDRSRSLHAQVASNNLVQNRMSYVAGWLVELADTPLARDAQAKKLVQLAVGDHQPLTADQLAAELPLHRIVAARPQKIDVIRGGLLHHTALDERAARDLERMLNQSVLVIPVPASCEQAP